MSDTNRLGLPYLLANQAQKHVTVNESLGRLDAIVQASVLRADLTEEPVSPAEGDVYLLPAGATGESWSGVTAGTLAVFRDGVWDLVSPGEGWRDFDQAARAVKVHVDGVWQTLTGLDRGTWPQVGVNTAPGLSQRLAVKSDTVLLSHDDVTPGSGDMRLILNRAGSASTASILFEDDFSAKAEFGLTGGTSLSLKIDLPVVGWTGVLSVDLASGNVGLGTNEPVARLDIAPGAGPLPGITGAVVLRLLNDAGQQTTFIADAIANNGDLSLRRANGTYGALSLVQATRFTHWV